MRVCISCGHAKVKTQDQHWDSLLKEANANCVMGHRTASPYLPPSLPPTIHPSPAWAPPPVFSDGRGHS